MAQDNILTESQTATQSPLAAPSKERYSVRSVLGTRRTDKSAPKNGDPEVELARLRKLVDEQEAAGKREQEQLKAFEKEASQARNDLKRIQKELDDSKAEHTAELRRATERETGLWNELAELRTQATKAAEKVSGYRKLAALSLCLVIPASLWAALVYHDAAVARAKASAEPVRKTIAALSDGPANEPPHDFTVDVRRLDQALNRLRHESAEAALRRIHDTNAALGISVCAFEWNGGQVSLLFGNQPGAGLGTSVTKCAEAVERAASGPGL